ncbi:hypothetical protein ACFY00_30290 [Kitasatospora sp. NPDC001540]
MSIIWVILAIVGAIALMILSKWSRSSSANEFFLRRKERKKNQR